MGRGWEDATNVFDAVAKPLLEGLTEANRPVAKAALKMLAQELEYREWVTQDETEYWSHPLIQEIFIELGTIVPNEDNS